jgi:hypothetical protein
MNVVLENIIGSLKLSSILLKQSVKDMKPEDIIVRPNDKANSVQFIVGHIVVSRYNMCQLLGDTNEHSFGKLFDRGEEINKSAEYPVINELKNEWDKVTSKLTDILNNVTDEKLSEKSPIDFPFPDKTLLGGIAFLTYHETYHIGQLAYNRRILGYDKLVG